MRIRTRVRIRRPQSMKTTRKKRRLIKEEGQGTRIKDEESPVGDNDTQIHARTHAPFNAFLFWG